MGVIIFFLFFFSPAIYKFMCEIDSGPEKWRPIHVELIFL